MVIKKEENIYNLLKNFVDLIEDVKFAFLYSRQGLLISKYGNLDFKILESNRVEAVHGALSALVENLLEKVSKEYDIGHFGTGCFETTDHRIIFLEAGPDAILLCVCNYDVDLNKLFPIAFLVAEKIAQLLEDSFDFKYNSLELSNLYIEDTFSFKFNDQIYTHSFNLENNIKMNLTIPKVKNVKKKFKLIILGSQAVGKTTLINCFLGKSSANGYRPTLGVSLSSKEFYIQGFKDEIITLQIYDLAGQEYFKRVRRNYYTGANCAFVIYDITKRETFEEAINFWVKDVREALGDIPLVLIGNKIDLDEKRAITREEAMKRAEEVRSFFIETSALNNINVQDTFKIIGIGLFFNEIELEN